ncbi:hypothetical protein Q1695_007910 [Nippostrongylus brasiliensis]|nr:hypothetical protein Q1695_007910 [Nippostrongylus brasiliensis]
MPIIQTLLLLFGLLFVAAAATANVEHVHTRIHRYRPRPRPWRPPSYMGEVLFALLVLTKRSAWMTVRWIDWIRQLYQNLMNNHLEAVKAKDVREPSKEDPNVIKPSTEFANNLSKETDNLIRLSHESANDKKHSKENGDVREHSKEDPNVIKPSQEIVNDKKLSKENAAESPRRAVDSKEALPLQILSKEGFEGTIRTRLGSKERGGSFADRIRGKLRSYKKSAKAQKSENSREEHTDESKERKSLLWRPKKSPRAMKSGSSSTRKRKMMGVREKESHKKPVMEFETAEAPDRITDNALVNFEIVDVNMLQHKIKQRAKRLRCYSDVLCGISTALAIICLLVAIIASFKSRVEYAAQRTARAQMNKEWTSTCLTRTMERKIQSSVLEKTDCYPNTIATADWSPWSECIEGIKYRWKIMKKNVKYLFETPYYEEEDC